MRLGVIGVGRIGRLHAGILAARPDVERVVVTDVDLAAATRVAETSGYDVAPDAEDLISQCDGVVVAATTSAHAHLLRLGVDAGRPVFCEKPIALDLETSRAVSDHVRSVGGIVQMGFQRRFDPGYRAAHDLVSSGAMGTLYAIHVWGHDPEPPPDEYIPHSGGLFRDFGVHDFDAIRFVTGDEIVEVCATGSVRAFPVFERHHDIDTGVAFLTLASGAQVVGTWARHDPRGYDVRMELFGSGDSVAVGLGSRTPLRSLEVDGPLLGIEAHRGFQDRFRVAYENELSDFIGVVAGARPVACDVTDATEALRVAAACDLSRAERRPVRIDEL